MTRSRTLSNLPRQTARLRETLQNSPDDKLRYFAICADSNDLPTEQEFKAFQVGLEMERRGVSVNAPSFSVEGSELGTRFR